MVIDVPDGRGGVTRGIGTPVTLAGKSDANTSPAPRVGEHSVAVLRDLGLLQAEIQALFEAGAIAQT